MPHTQPAPYPPHLRLWPLAIALIVMSTAVGVDVRDKMILFEAFRFGQRDFVLNLLLYAPLGLALSRKPITYTILIAAMLSVGAEALQMLYPARHPAVADVVANVLGAALGGLGAHWLRKGGVSLESVAIPSPMWLTFALGALSILWLAYPSDRASDFSNWDPAYGLTVGDEFTRDRPWHGGILELAILSAAVGHDDVDRMYTGGVGSVREFTTTGRAPAIFELPGPVRVDSLSGRALLGGADADAFYDALVEANEMSIIAWVVPGGIEQTEAGRIITFSQDRYYRNFTLEQKDRRFAFRLRTPISGENGLLPQTITPRLHELGEKTLVVATYDGGISRIYVNGDLITRQNIRSYRAPLPALEDYGLPVTAFVLACMAALGCIAAAQHRAVRRKWVLLPASSMIATAILLASGGGSAVPDAGVWMLAIGAAAGLIVAASIESREPGAGGVI